MTDKSVAAMSNMGKQEALSLFNEIFVNNKGSQKASTDIFGTDAVTAVALSRQRIGGE
ncbi:hypothetical protein ACFL0H_07845 [Thermodesulfobacteriota bacterium]